MNNTARWSVERAGFALVQDLGRPGHAWLGVAVNGASDHRSACTANVLVGNADDAPLLEIVGSELRVRTDADCLVAVTGAVTAVEVDGAPAPAHQPLLVAAGSRLSVPGPDTGVRSYLAVNGAVEADRHLGSVAPDALLGIGRRLQDGDQLVVRSAYRARDHRRHFPLYRMGPTPPPPSGRHHMSALPGPDLHRLTDVDQLSDPLVVLPQSDHVGVRLQRADGEPVPHNVGHQILSRGVPVGAVELLPAGGIAVLLRGRLVTAGYPVVAVVGSAHLDILGQARPGDEVRLWFTDAGTERAALVAWHEAHVVLAARVRQAFAATGIGSLVDPAHGRTRSLEELSA